MPPYSGDEEIKHFLDGFRSVSGKEITNTSIGNPKASLYVSDEKYDEFINEYCKLLAKQKHLHLVEKPRECSNFRVDLDFRFAFGSTQIPEKIPRIYTTYDIEKIVKKYQTLLKEYLDVEDNKLKAYVMEKPNPTNYKGKIKDGIHIVFPEIHTNYNFQHFIRHRVIQDASKMFEGLPLTNTHENIIDEAIIEKNYWQMYGSSKPDCETYLVTRIYTYDTSSDYKLVDVPIPDASEQIEWAKYFSMRKNVTPTPINESKVTEIEEFVRIILPSKTNKKKDLLQQQIFGNIINLVKSSVSDEELGIARKLVKCLNKSRSDDYNDWIKLGWILRNIDYRLLDSWIEFSEISDKNTSGECEKLWDRMRQDTLGMGTLRYWAKNDNPSEYSKVDEDNVNSYIDKAISTKGADYDVAMVVATMYKHQYRFITKDIWYVFNENKHRWEQCKDALPLRKIIYQEVCQKFINRSTYWNNQSIIRNEEEDEKERCQNKCKIAIEISCKLKKSAFNDSVVKVCKVLFSEPKFEEKLDDKPNLVGFENGVYDLRLHEFREGLPDDYISYSTGRSYIPHNPQSNEVKEIEGFLSQVFTNPVIRKFAMDILSSTLDGGIRHEKFYIFTGSGSNGKSKLLELVQKAVGDYYCILPISLLTQKRAASNTAQSELERTKGRRFAVMQEPSEGERINIGLMKELSGGDTIQCRGLFKEPIEFKPQFKMTMTCNELPEVPSDDGGTWRRIRVINFDSKFTDTPNSKNPKEFHADVELCNSFERWASAFISMLIDNHKNTDMKHISEPMEVRIATESYKKNNDIIGQYISEKIVDDTENMHSKDQGVMLNNLYTDFRIWVSQNIPKGKRVPDRMQLRSYMENIYGPYPENGKGWKAIKYHVDYDSSE